VGEPANARNLNIAAISYFLLIVFLPVATNAATGDIQTPRIINLCGLPVPSIYHGLKSDAKFAAQLKALATSMDSADGTGTPVLRKKASQCPVAPRASLRLASYALPQGHPCYGQYMQPEWYDCGIDCDPEMQYERFYNTGSDPHNGYYIPIMPDVCNGCEIAEVACYNP